MNTIALVILFGVAVYAVVLLRFNAQLLTKNNALLTENSVLRSTLKTIEETHRNQLAALRQLFNERIEAMQHEIADIRQRWTVSASEQQWQSDYIEILEESHFANLIALPRKPRKRLLRPVIKPTSEEDNRDITIIDEMTSGVVTKAEQWSE